jgi:cytochrome P450
MSQPDGAQVLNYPIAIEVPLEPPAEWARLQQKCPVARVRLASGDEAELVTRYEDVKAVLSDPRFPRPSQHNDGARVSEDESGGVFNSEMASVLPQSGEGHLQWRRMLNKWFTAKRMLALRPRIEVMANQLIDELRAKPAPADLKGDLGFPLTVWVICDMLGVPDSDRGKFAYWSDTLLSMTRYTKEEIVTAQTAFGKYLAGHIATKRAEPGEDVLSELIGHTDANGEALSDAVLIATAMGLLVAGHETTANMIGKMMGMLLVDRSRWEKLVADPSLIRSAVEEALRMDVDPGLGMLRFITEDVELAGTTVPAGTTVMCSMAAANRDETTFAGANEMDLGRNPNPHLAFGAGSHSCLGQALARTELQVVLDVLIRRMPTVELAVPKEDLRRVEGLIVGGLREVPVRW